MIPKKKKQEYLKNQHGRQRNLNHQLLEIQKAVAQAWLSHFNNASRLATMEFDVRKMKFQAKPSRFKLEASSKKKVEDDINKAAKGKIWDFKQSLWDSYEIMAVWKTLECGLVLGYDGFDSHVHRIGDNSSLFKKRKENKNYSFRNLFNKMSPRRLSDVGVYGREDEEEEEEEDFCVHFCSPFLL